MDQLVMLSGIPRSGSQVLSSLLNQHPQIYSSTTSPLVDALLVLEEAWPGMRAHQIDAPPDQFDNMLRGVVQGAYSHIPKPIVVDKNRLWARHTQLAARILKSRPKIICTVRDIPEVLASFVLLIERNSHKVTYVDQDLKDMGLPINTKNRCRVLWERYIYHPYTSLRIGYNSAQADMLVLDYHHIVDHSQTTMDKVCEFLGIESVSVNTHSLQPMPENDQAHGGLEGLHEVRAQMKRTSPPAHEVIGRELVHLYTSMKLDFWRNPRTNFAKN